MATAMAYVANQSQGASGGSATNAVRYNTIWYTWNLNEASSTTATTTIWNAWTATSGQNFSIHQSSAGSAQTKEQVKEAREKYQREQAERERIQKVADQLLMDHLTEEQREQVKKNGWFVIEGGKSKKKYRIETKGGVHGNVYELNDKEKVIGSYCFQLQATFPKGDHLLAQKLCLEYDEEATLKVANFTRFAA